MTAPTTNVTIFDRDEIDLIAAFAGCSLDESPGSNWVQDVGGLPEYICRVARAIKRSGKTTSQAISIAVDRMKKWATGVGVNKDTQAKAVAALAEWEAKRAKSNAKTAAKKVAATNALAGNILCLANVDYNVDIVRTAFENRTRQARRDWRVANPTAAYEDGPPSWWCRELWSTFLIVSADYGPEASLYKVPYEVDDNLDVTFGEPIEVKTQYVVVSEADMTTDIPEADLQKLLAATSTRATPSERFLHLGTRSEPSHVDKIVALAADTTKKVGITIADGG